MSSVMRRIDQGELEPRYAQNGGFSKEISIEQGVLKYIDIYFAGDHATAITGGGATDGEFQPIQEIQVRIPRVNGDPVIWNWKPRDLKWLTYFFSGGLPARANPAGDGLNHFGLMRIPLALPKRLTTNPGIWGIMADEIKGKIRITGTYGAVTSIGPASTAITHVSNVTTGVALPQRRRGRPLRMERPQMILSGQENRFAIESDARHGPLVIQTGTMHKLYAVFMRQHDNSATAAQRVDGLITRLELKHTDYDTVLDEFHAILKKSTQQFYHTDAADTPAGISIYNPSRKGLPREMPDMFDSQVLTVTADTNETPPVEFANVTPAVGDALYANVIGAVFTQDGLRNARNAGVSIPNRR